jgi:hypothetical protein
LAIILIPVFYAVIIPGQIRDSISNPKLDQTDFKIVLGSFGDSNLRVDVNMEPITWVPGIASLKGPTTFDFSESPTFDKPLGTLTISDVTFPANQKSFVSFGGNMTVAKVPSLQNIIGFVTGSPVMIYMKSSWTIQFWGITWYSNFLVNGVYDLNSKTGKEVRNEFNNSSFQLPFKISS